MNRAPISTQTRKHWLWFFAVLLPVILFGFLKEQESWKPRIIQLPLQRPKYGYLETNQNWLQDGRLACVSQNKIILLNPNTCKIEKIISTDQRFTSSSGAISDDGKTFFVGGSSLHFAGVHSDNSVSILRGNKLINQTKMLKWDEHIEEIRIFNAKTGKLLRTMPGSKNFQINGDNLYTVCYVPDEKISKAKGILYVSKERDFEWQKGKLFAEARIYNWRTDKLLSKVRLTTSDSDEYRIGGSIDYVAWSPDYKVAIVNFEGMIIGETKADSGEGSLGNMEFDLKTGQARKLLPKDMFLPFHKPFFAINQYSPSQNLIQIWTFGHTGKIAEFVYPSNYWLSDLSSDGKYIILQEQLSSNATNQHIQIMDCQTGRITRNFKIKSDSDWIREERFSPDNKTLAVSLGTKVMFYRLK